MNFTFRTDASLQIGTGHVARCLVAAHALKAQGHAARFLCRNLEGNRIDAIRKEGFEVSVLPRGSTRESGATQHAHWLEASLAEEISATQDALKKAPVTDWLVVDHYALDETWENAQRAFCKKIFAIDDLADRRHVADLLLDQNHYERLEHRYDGLVPKNSKLLLGPRYAMLRPQFQQIRVRVARSGKTISRILVFLSGIDARGTTLKVLEALENVRGEIELKKIGIDIVIGSASPALQKIKERAKSWAGATCHVDTQEMASLMAAASFCIGAGGSTTLERFCTGLPSIVMSLARNQEEMCRFTAESGYHEYLGRADEVSVAAITEKICWALDRFEAFQEMGARGMELVDGKGVDRLLKELVNL